MADRGEPSTNRRRLLLLGTAAAGSVAGCTSLLGENSTPDSDNGQSPSGSKANTDTPNPQLSWSEDWLQGTSYRVTVSVQLNGAEKVMIRQGRPGGQNVATITSSGEHTIGGPDTENGPLGGGKLLFAVRPSAEKYVDTKSVGSYMVGSQEQATFPVHLRGLKGSTDPNLENSGTLSRTFAQDTSTGPTSLSLKIPRVLYQYYKGRDRVRNFGMYVSDTYDDQYIEGIVDEFQSFGERNGFSDPEIIDLMMGFVQNLEYTSDKVSAGYNEYPKFPVETLVDREGDCEDSAILLASMLEQFGYGTVLLKFDAQQHMALGLAGDASISGTYYEQDGQRYYYVETTAPGWRVGQLPRDMNKGNPDLVPVNSSGVLVFTYVVKTPSSGGVNVEVQMKNVGDAAGNARARVTFENRSGSTVASKWSDSTTLQPTQETTKTVQLAPPDDQTLRAKVSVELDGTIRDSITSEYRDPIQS